MRSQFKSFTIAVLALLMLTGCGSITANSTDSQLAANYDGADTKIGMVETSQAAIDRQLIQTASIALRVDDVAETATAITSYVNGIQGRIDSKNEYRNPDSSAITSADFMIKVPSDKLDEALDRLKTFGDLEGFSTSATDVTLQVVDLDARIAALQNSISSLKKLLEDASNVSDLLAAEAALTQRQSELDGLTSQRNYLADQIDLAAIWVSVYPKNSLAAIKPIGFIAGLEKGWEEIVKFASNLTTWSGLALPWIGLVVALLLIFKIIGGLRKLRRKN
ncbi:MAG: DUF4349 domain-containing protein [Actinomycetota bacterium]|nr:DUF4349 domain-containing protein [Actinomycetota bacterium]